MKKNIAKLFMFLLPLLRTASLQVAADAIARLAYGDNRRRPIRSTPAPYNRMADSKPKRGGYYGLSDYATKDVAETRTLFSSEGRFHDVLMVAFDITGPNEALVHEWLSNAMPTARTYAFLTHDVDIDSWWIADDGAEGDCDSAVFVSKGNQTAARALLREHGLVE